MSEHPEPTTDPIARFRALFERAEATDMVDPNAMVVSTVDALGRPSSRVVLLKSFDERGFVFYTNLESRKGGEIAANPHVCLNFFWRELDRQVRVRGRAEPVDREEADAYFASRPRDSQLGAWASRQSRPLADRRQLLDRIAEHEARFANEPVPRPPFWSGFRVVPSSIEIWAAGEARLHERVVYEKTVDGWTATTLYP